MRHRDIRAARKQAAAQDWRAAWEPVPANDEAQPDPEGDAYWLDAIAGADNTPASVDAAGTYTD